MGKGKFPKMAIFHFWVLKLPEKEISELLSPFLAVLLRTKWFSRTICLLVVPVCHPIGVWGGISVVGVTRASTRFSKSLRITPRQRFLSIQCGPISSKEKEKKRKRWRNDDERWGHNEKSEEKNGNSSLAICLSVSLLLFGSLSLFLLAPALLTFSSSLLLLLV